MIQKLLQDLRSVLFLKNYLGSLIAKKPKKLEPVFFSSVKHLNRYFFYTSICTFTEVRNANTFDPSVFGVSWRLTRPLSLCLPAWANVKVEMEDRVEVFRGATAQISCLYESPEGTGGTIIEWLYVSWARSKQTNKQVRFPHAWSSSPFFFFLLIPKIADAVRREAINLLPGRLHASLPAWHAIHRPDQREQLLGHAADFDHRQRAPGGRAGVHLSHHHADPYGAWRRKHAAEGVW